MKFSAHVVSIAAYIASETLALLKNAFYQIGMRTRHSLSRSTARGKRAKSLCSNRRHLRNVSLNQPTSPIDQNEPSDNQRQTQNCRDT